MYFVNVFVNVFTYFIIEKTHLAYIMLPNQYLTNINEAYHLPTDTHLRPVNEFEDRLRIALDINIEDNPLNADNDIIDDYDELPTIVSISVENTYYTLEQRELHAVYLDRASSLKNIISQCFLVDDIRVYRWSLAAFADGDGNVEYRIYVIQIVDKTVIHCGEKDILNRIASGLVDELPDHYHPTRTSVVLSGELVITPPKEDGVVGVLINCLSNICDRWMEASSTVSPTALVYTLILNMFAKLSPPRVLVQYEIVKIPNSPSFIRTHLTTCPIEETPADAEAYLLSRYGADYVIYKFSNTEDYQYYYRSTHHARETHLSISRLTDSIIKCSRTPSVYYANMFHNLSPLTEEERGRFAIN